MNFLVYTDDESDTVIYLKSQLLLLYELMILVWGSSVLSQKGFGAFFVRERVCVWIERV